VCEINGTNYVHVTL